MDRGAWGATVRGAAEPATTERSAAHHPLTPEPQAGRGGAHGPPSLLALPLTGGTAGIRVRGQTRDPGCWAPVLVLPAPRGLGQIPYLLSGVLPRRVGGKVESMQSTQDRACSKDR